MNRTILLMFGFLWLFAGSSLAAADKEHDLLVKELMQKSGLVKQVGGIPGQIQATLVQTQQQSGRLSPEQFKELSGMMAASYKAKTLIADVENHIKYNLTSSDIRSILQWLNTGLGKKITRFEEGASTPEAATKIMAIAANLANQDSKRIKKMDQLDNAVKATDFSVTAIQGVQIAMTMGMMSGMPEKERMSLEVLTKNVKSNSPQLYPVLKPQVIASFLYSYRELSDGEIDQYIKFASTKSAIKYHAATMNGLSIAMSNASEVMGNNIIKKEK